MGNLLPDPGDKFIILVTSKSIENRKSQNYRFFFSPPSVCRVPWWHLHLLESYGTAISPGTALTRLNCFYPFGTSWVDLPARGKTARGMPSPHTLQPKDSHPQKIQSPKLHRHVQCLLDQCYLQGTSAKDKILKPGPPTSLCLPDCLLGISETMQVLHHFEESKSWPCLQMIYLQVGPAGPKDGLGSSLNYMWNMHRE